MKRKFKLLLVSLVIILIAIPNVYAFYYKNYKSSIISKFNVNDTFGNTYVRATILTYWVDTTSCNIDLDYTTCDISGKSSWALKDNVINQDWYLLKDGFYYYKSSINGSEFDFSNIKTSDIALIDSLLSIEDLTSEELTSLEIVPQYEVVYEFIEANGISESWNVTYRSGVPTLIN